MAQTLFEALAGDNQTALAVQSLLESQTAAESVDDDDVFQCGKCKKQFSALSAFLEHKHVRCTPVAPKPALPSAQLQGIGSSLGSAFTASVPHTIHRPQLTQPSLSSYGPVPPSPLTQLTQGMVLTDDQMLAFGGLDQSSLLQTSALHLAGNTVQATGPFLSQVAINTPARATTNVTILSPIQSQSTLASNGSAFTSTVSANSLQPPPVQQNQQITIVVPEKPQPAIIKPSPTKAGRKSAQANLITILDGENVTVKQRRSKVGMVAEDPEGKRKLHCQYCDKAFAKNFDLQQHVRSHTGEKPFQCIVCGRAFAQKSNVKKHMATHKVWPTGSGSTLPEQPSPQVLPPVQDQPLTLQGPALNTETALPSNTSVVLQEQVVATSQENIHVAEPSQAESGAQPEGSSSDTTSNTRSEGKKAGPDNMKLKVVIDNSYLCQYCPQKFKSYFLLKTHMVQHKNEQVYKCVMKNCSGSFKDLDAFLEHTATHQSEMTYRCHQCNKVFSSLFELGAHQYTHSLYPNQGPKPGPRHFQCNKCMNKYSTPEALDYHLTTASHNFPCPHCEKIFTCERYLRRHLPTHGTEGQFKCEVCQKVFKTEHYLKMHGLIHTGEKPFSCDLCGAAFNRKDKLRRHSVIHDKKVRYKCPFKTITGCVKEFNRPDKLKAHIISHSGIKPFICNLCGKGFSRRPHLTEHERCHRAEYKFKCDACGRGFFRPKLFNEHKCVPRKDGAPHVYKPRLNRRKCGRPRKRMITITSDMVGKGNNNNNQRKHMTARLASLQMKKRKAAEAARLLKEEKEKMAAEYLHDNSNTNNNNSEDGLEEEDVMVNGTDDEVERGNNPSASLEMEASQSDEDIKMKKAKTECYVRNDPPVSMVEQYVTVHLANAANCTGNTIQTHLIPTASSTQLLSHTAGGVSAYQPITIIETQPHILAVSHTDPQMTGLPVANTAALTHIPVDIVTVTEDQVDQTYVTCDSNMVDYGVGEPEADPVLQGTESLINASAEILRSAQQTSDQKYTLHA